MQAAEVCASHSSPTAPSLGEARSGITDVLDGDKVIVELTSLPAEPILDRIVVVPVEKLRVL